MSPYGHVDAVKSMLKTEPNSYKLKALFISINRLRNRFQKFLSPF